MRSISSLIIFLIFTTTPGWAEGWAMRQGDVALTQAQMEVMVVGRTLTFYDNGRSQFGSDGSYAYSYDQGDTARGQYQLGQDGTICIAFENGWARCDLYVQNDARMVLITEKGERFPIRP